MVSMDELSVTPSNSDMLDQTSIGTERIQLSSAALSNAQGATEKSSGELEAESRAAVSSPGTACKIKRSTNLDKIGMRKHHLAVLTTIVHRSFLEGNYIRAGRALAMMLRTEVNGQSMDLRAGQRWGLAAEVLLRPYEHRSRSMSTQDVGNCLADINDHGSRIKRFFTVKAYYKRLQLQYPHNKSFPQIVGPLEFFIATYSLWLKNALHEFAMAREPQEIPHILSEIQTISARENLRSEVNRIKDGIDELLTFPPISAKGSYVNLQHMVTKWLNDLDKSLR